MKVSGRSPCHSQFKLGHYQQFEIRSSVTVLCIVRAEVYRVFSLATRNPLKISRICKLSLIERVHFSFRVLREPFINQSIIIWTLKTKSLLPLPLQKGGITPFWQRGATCLREAASAKAGGRFPERTTGTFVLDVPSQPDILI